MTYFKKSLCIFLSALFIFSLFSFSGSANAVSGSIYDYEIKEDGTAKITDYYGYYSSLDIPSEIDGYTVTEIGDWAFSNKNFYTVTMPDTITKVGRYVFQGCHNLTEVDLSENLTEIAYSMFSGCDHLTSITIPDKVTLIDEYAFDCCYALALVSIPDGVTSIGYRAFICTYALKSIDLPDSLEYIGDNAFWGSSFESLVIPDSVTYIGKEAFNTCESLESVSISSGVTFIGEGAFTGCDSLKTITLENNLYYFVKDGVLFDKNITTLMCYPPMKDGSTYLVPSTVTAISAQAFSENVYLETVTLPSSLKTIGIDAFMYMDSLESIFIPKNVTKVPYNVFQNCENLKTVILPNTLVTIEGNAFQNCYSLETIVIPDSVTAIGGMAFSNCTNLKSVKIGSKVETIYEEAFMNCKSLSNITIPASVKTIRPSVFSYCNNLKTITVNNSNKYYASSNGVLFDKSLTQLVQYPTGKADATYQIPKGIKTICKNAFSGNKQIKSVTLPDSLLTIESYAFSGCSNLASISPLASVRTLGDSVFGDTNLTSVTILSNTTEIGYELNYGEPLTVYGFAGSYVEEYINIHGYQEYKFIPIDPYTVVLLPKDNTTLYISGTETINSQIINPVGNTTYKSSNTKIATVNAKGVITAKKAGKSTITVTNNGISKKFTVTVKKPILNKTNLTLKKKKTFTLSVTGQIGKAKFTSTNSKVAKVNSKGKITAKKKGNATIKVKTNGITLKCKVKVK